MSKNLYTADILLPKSGFEKFSVIACDQYTSEPDYWNALENAVGTSPSALHLTLPEIYLGDKIHTPEKINATMMKYLALGVFAEYKNEMIFVERTTVSGKIRRGIVGAIDLEEYDYRPGADSAIRATEQTVLERIPPRARIREGAPIELPHVMLLCDDPENDVYNMIEREKSHLTVAYDFDLLCGGGHIKGYFLGEKLAQKVDEAFGRLRDARDDKMLFAVGDGNHSLAAAKACYDAAPNELNRYALVEIVNIHDETIQFEPIYRVLFGVEPKAVIGRLMEHDVPCDASHEYTAVFGEDELHFVLGATSSLPVGTLQTLLDEYVAETGVKIDYVHGVANTRALCRNENTVGFIFDGMDKSELFDAVSADGSLPRKTFSLGAADDKRFYLEGRRIK